MEILTINSVTEYMGKKMAIYKTCSYFFQHPKEERVQAIIEPDEAGTIIFTTEKQRIIDLVGFDFTASKEVFEDLAMNDNFQSKEHTEAFFKCLSTKSIFDYVQKWRDRLSFDESHKIRDCVDFMEWELEEERKEAGDE